MGVVQAILIYCPRTIVWYLTNWEIWIELIHDQRWTIHGHASWDKCLFNKNKNTNLFSFFLSPTMYRILRWRAWRFISCHLQRFQNWSPKTRFHEQVQFLQASSQKWFRGENDPPFFQELSEMYQILRSISGETCHSSHLINHWIFFNLLYEKKVWIYLFIWKLVFYHGIKK